MVLTRIHTVITGRVQGVFFRACTHDEAQRLGISGWVRNCADGSVEAELQGDETEVKRMLNWLYKGSPMSQVTKVASRPLAVIDGEKGFTIRY